MWNEEYCNPKHEVMSLEEYPKHEVKANAVEYMWLDGEKSYGGYWKQKIEEMYYEESWKQKHLVRSYVAHWIVSEVYYNPKHEERNSGVYCIQKNVTNFAVF